MYINNAERKNIDTQKDVDKGVKSYAKVLKKILDILAEEKYTAAEAKQVIQTALLSIESLSIMTTCKHSFKDSDFSF